MANLGDMFSEKLKNVLNGFDDYIANAGDTEIQTILFDARDELLNECDGFVFEEHSTEDEALAFAKQAKSFFDKLITNYSGTAEIETHCNNILFASKLAGFIDNSHWEKEVNPTLFHVRTLAESFTFFNRSNKKSNFLSHVNSRASDSFQYLFVTDEIISEGNSFDFFTGLLLLAYLDSHVSIFEKPWLVSRFKAPARIQDCITYHMVLSGYFSTPTVPTPFSGLSMLQNHISLHSKKFKQYNQVFEHLGEINRKSGLLDAMLSTWHVIEDFMVRRQIVKTQIANSTEFSIMDFRRLFRNVENKEKDSLEKFMNPLWDREFGGTSLIDFASARHAALIPQLAGTESDVYKTLRIGNKTPLNGTNSIKQRFPEILYSIRCSIVHNKTTEFHLTNLSLVRHDDLKLYISEFILPVSALIAFGLPNLKNNNPIGYLSDSVKLY